jgi:hypothetical protein
MGVRSLGIESLKGVRSAAGTAIAARVRRFAQA